MFFHFVLYCWSRLCAYNYNINHRQWRFSILNYGNIPYNESLYTASRKKLHGLYFQYCYPITGMLFSAQCRRQDNKSG